MGMVLEQRTLAKTGCELEAKTSPKMDLNRKRAAAQQGAWAEKEASQMLAIENKSLGREGTPALAASHYSRSSLARLRWAEGKKYPSKIWGLPEEKSIGIGLGPRRATKPNTKMVSF